MRYLGIEWTEKRTRVMYRWLDDPLAPPRMLVVGAALSLETLRPMLEKALGADLDPEAYTILTAQPELEPMLAQVFAPLGARIMAGVPFEELVFRATPLTFDQLCDQLDSGLVRYAAEPSAARAALSVIRERAFLPVVSKSWRAERLIAPSLMALRLRLRTVSLNEAETVESALPVLVAIASDPGISGREAALLRKRPSFATLIDTNQQEEDFYASAAYIREGIAPIDLIEVEALTPLLHEELVRQLLDWLEQQFTDTDIDPSIQKRIQYTVEYINRFMI